MWTVTNVTDEAHHVPLLGVTLNPGESTFVDDPEVAEALAANAAFALDGVDEPYCPPVEDPPGD